MCERIMLILQTLANQTNSELSLCKFVTVLIGWHHGVYARDERHATLLGKLMDVHVSWTTCGKLRYQGPSRLMEG